MRDKRPSRPARQIEDASVTWRECLEIGDVQREVADCSALNLDIHSLLCGPAQRFVNGYAHDRNNQAIAELIRLPHRVDRCHSTDDHALGSARAIDKRYRCVLREDVPRRKDDEETGGPDESRRERSTHAAALSRTGPAVCSNEEAATRPLSGDSLVRGSGLRGYPDVKVEIRLSDSAYSGSSTSSKNSSSSAIRRISQSEYIASPMTNRHTPDVSTVTMAAKSTSMSSPWT